MRTLYYALLTLVIVLSSACGAQPKAQPQTILFVGNSLTYVGNTPAVFDALAAANGFPISSDMIVRGGATLTQRVNDGSVARALAAKHYTAVVLQERGGDLMCAFGPSSCVESRSAIQALTSLAKRAGANVYLLGTYQDNQKASEALISAESAAAAEAGIPYIGVSGKLQALRASEPDMGWFASDGMHPGPSLALLNATLLHQTLLHKEPRPAALTVAAPIYGITSGLVENVRGAEDPPPLPATPSNIQYSAETVQQLLRSLGTSAGS